LTRAISAKCSGFAPYFSMYSMPALPKIWAVMGPFSHPAQNQPSVPTAYNTSFLDHKLNRLIKRRGMLREMILQRPYRISPPPFFSGAMVPASICSHPTHKTQSALPPRIAFLPIQSAVLPVEQLLFTFTIGICVIPS
jgi:hypothetical protein